MITVYLFPDKLSYVDYPSLSETFKAKNVRRTMIAHRWVPDVTVSHVQNKKDNPMFWKFHTAYRFEWKDGINHRIAVDPFAARRKREYVNCERNEGVTLMHLINAKVVRRKVLHVGYWQKYLTVNSCYDAFEVKREEEFAREDIVEGPDGREIECPNSYHFGNAPSNVLHHRMFATDEEFWAWVDPEYLEKMQFASRV